jgi:hypothetical protein
MLLESLAELCQRSGIAPSVHLLRQPLCCIGISTQAQKMVVAGVAISKDKRWQWEYLTWISKCGGINRRHSDLRAILSFGWTFGLRPCAPSKNDRLRSKPAKNRPQLKSFSAGWE